MKELIKKIKLFIHNDERYWKYLEVPDYRLIVSISFLLLFGVIMVFSASGASGGVSAALKQFVIGAAGVTAMLAISCFDYHRYAKHAGAIFIASLLALILVRIPGIGVTTNGAARWIQIGPLTFQPSELTKPAVILVSSVLIIKMGQNIAKIGNIVFYFAPATLASIMIYRVTENLSTAIIVFVIAAMMFFVAYPKKTIWIIVILLALAGVLLFVYVLLPRIEYAHAAGVTDSFRLRRFVLWLYPEDYPDLSRQSRYGLYSIGFGGFWGRGLGSGTVKYYLAEATNDFIFAVIAEELGVVGCAIVIYLFIYTIWRIWTIAKHAGDALGSYIAFGIGAHIAVQSLFNIAVACGALPNTGIGLPFVGRGGTAILIQLAEIGVVLNIGRQIHAKRVRKPDEETPKKRKGAKPRSGGPEKNRIHKLN